MNSENPYKKYEALFERWPGVRAAQVGGENGMRVAGYHYTPGRTKMADALTIMVAVFWAGLLGMCFYTQYFRIWQDAEMWAAIAVGVWMLLTFASFLIITSRSSKATIVYFSPSHIQIGQKTYDARVQHKFSMDIHRKAKEEADAELRAQQRNPKNASIRHKKYYRDAFHIFFEYLGQRILVTDISTEEGAEQFLRALDAVDRIMHKEKTVFVANTNTEDPAETVTDARQVDYFGKRPAMD